MNFNARNENSNINIQIQILPFNQFVFRQTLEPVIESAVEEQGLEGQYFFPTNTAPDRSLLFYSDFMVKFI